MLTYLQAIVLGALQGLTELFPVSSLGHSVVLPPLLRWPIDQTASNWLVFLVATHAATALALLIIFRRDWLRIIKGLGRSLRDREISAKDPDARLGWLLIVGTIPAGILGLLFEDSLKALLASPRIVAFVLILNGLLLLGAETLRKRTMERTEAGSDQRVATKLTWTQNLGIGLMQSLALIPGFSRTGATITGGLLSGLSHEDAARFSFLLATPIIGAAALLKLPDLALRGVQTGPILVGAAMAGICAYLTATFLTKYFETKTLKPFALYCALIGVILTVYFW